MKNSKFSLQEFTGGRILSRAEMKNVGGGAQSNTGTASCSCTLKSSTGAKLSLPDNVTSQWTTDADCKSGCQKYCDGANAAGGDCKSANYTFLISTIED